MGDLGYHLKLSGMFLAYVTARSEDHKGTSMRVGEHEGEVGSAPTPNRQGRKPGAGRGWGALTVGVFCLPQPTSLQETPGHRLDKFIKDFLQPSEDFLSRIQKAVDIICRFLKENCFRHSTTKVQKAVKVSTGLSPKACHWQGAEQCLELCNTHLPPEA